VLDLIRQRNERVKFQVVVVVVVCGVAMCSWWLSFLLALDAFSTLDALCDIVATLIKAKKNQTLGCGKHIAVQSSRGRPRALTDCYSFPQPSGLIFFGL